MIEIDRDRLCTCHILALQALQTPSSSTPSSSSSTSSYALPKAHYYVNTRNPKTLLAKSLQPLGRSNLHIELLLGLLHQLAPAIQSRHPALVDRIQALRIEFSQTLVIEPEYATENLKYVKTIKNMHEHQSHVFTCIYMCLA